MTSHLVSNPYLSLCHISFFLFIGWELPHHPQIATYKIIVCSYAHFCHYAILLEIIFKKCLAQPWPIIVNLFPLAFCQISVLPPEEENISQLMGYLTGLQGVPPTSGTSPIKYACHRYLFKNIVAIIKCQIEHYLEIEVDKGY